MVVWLLFAMQAAPDLDTAVAHYRATTRAAIECRAGAPDDILICGRREADRWRVPLTEIDPADPKNQGVPMERERLLARTNNCEELSTFLVGCGKAGVSVSSRTGVSLIGERPIAP
jgi:hypothetical protein